MRKTSLTIISILFFVGVAWALSGMSPEVINNIWTFEKAPKFTSLTANRILALDSNKQLFNPTIGSSGTVAESNGTTESYVAKNTYREATIHNFATLAVSWTLSTDEALCLYLSGTNANAACTINGPATGGKVFFFRNGTGQAVQFKSSAGTGVSITNAKSAWLLYSTANADYIKMGSEF